MSTSTRIFQSGLAAALSLLFWGCAGSSGSSPQFNTVSGHPTNYLATHWSDYAQHPDQCSSCHGSITDPNAAGGIAKVSCFTCHPMGPAHPSGWGDPAKHGQMGADAVANTNAKPPANWTGMTSCAKCHGDDFAGGISAVSCLKCHTKAPHPDAPWAPTTSNPAPAFSHSYFVSDTNAPECFKCHANGAHFSGTKPVPPAAGTAPGCFNNTMCHGQI